MHFANILPLQPAFLHPNASVVSTMFGEWTEPYCLKCCGDIDSQILSCREEPSLLHHLASSHYFLGLLQIVPDQINLSANSSSKHHRIVLPVCPWGLAIQCVLDSAVCSRGIRKMCRKSTFCRSLTSDRNQPVFTCIHSSHGVIFFFIGPPHTAALMLYSTGGRRHKNWLATHCKFQRFSYWHFRSSLSPSVAADDPWIWLPYILLGSCFSLQFLLLMDPFPLGHKVLWLRWMTCWSKDEFFVE